MSLVDLAASRAYRTVVFLQTIALPVMLGVLFFSRLLLPYQPPAARAPRLRLQRPHAPVPRLRLQRPHAPVLHLCPGPLMLRRCLCLCFCCRFQIVEIHLTSISQLLNPDPGCRSAAQEPRWSPPKPGSAR
ncbi:hypothetical protein GDO81_018571 [Engystomops pustulosus]|uniref:Uncharacterized protein n=1 Tax=Engystomops pustulosus TaxID=76066 RepID=A0AAV6YGN7_ENGPU|nr:hypothetical protein GDO81_018571 [Engystomops pustulosus]